MIKNLFYNSVVFCDGAILMYTKNTAKYFLVIIFMLNFAYIENWEKKS